MKVSNILLGSLLLAGTAIAQEAPNRIIVHNTGGTFTGYVTDRIDKIGFANVDEDVEAEVIVNQVALDKLVLTVQRTEACRGFKISVIPELTARQLTNDVQMIAYINSTSPAIYYEDFINGEMSGIQLSAGSQYRVVTVGIDEYGVEAGISYDRFTTPMPDVVGNPKVNAEVTANGLFSFTVKFTPNSDVSSYSYVAGEKGQMMEQYYQFAPMFGFTNFNEMVEAWGVRETGNSTYTWKDMTPNTDYEIFVAMRDKAGNFADYQVYETSTLSLGGEGEAMVDISVEKYELADWEGEMKPSLYVHYQPNDQASCYRFNVYTKEQYDQYGDDELFADLCQDPPMPMAYWFFYDPLTTDYQINPGTDIVVIAAAKNINGEWGRVNKFEYTTGALETRISMPVSSQIATRSNHRLPAESGKMPILKANRPTLTHR